MIQSVILAAAVMYQFAATAAPDPSSGYSTTVEFGAPAVAESEGGRSLTFHGASLRTVPGEPVRPEVVLFVPVPPGSDPVLTYTASGLLPTGFEGTEARAAAVTGEGLSAVEVPTDPLPPPSVHAELEGVIPMAGCEFAVIHIYPVTGPEPSSYASTVDVRLEWTPTPGGVPVERSGLPAMLAPPGTLCWPVETRPERDSRFWGRPWARISLDRTGGFSVSGADLDDAGCPALGYPCESLSLYTGPGRMFGDEPEAEHTLSEVAVTVIDSDGDGVFDPEDRIRFIGRSLDRWSLTQDMGRLERLQHRYATHNVYWLTWGGGSGARMGTISGAPDGSPSWGTGMTGNTWHREQSIWQPRFELTTGWLWDAAPSGEKITVQVQASGSGGTGNLHVALTMDKATARTVDLILNGTTVLSETWSGSGERELAVEGVDFASTNTLEVLCSDGIDELTMGLVSVRVENVTSPGNLTGELLFPSLEKQGRFVFDFEGAGSDASVFDLSEFCEPLQLTGTVHSGGTLSFSYQCDSSSVLMVVDGDEWISPDSISSASPGRLVGTVSSGDRLLVVDGSMLDDIWALTALSTESGFEPVVATTREVYDEFGQGVTDPGAIRSAVRWGMDSWAPGLESVTLVGDGHYDPLGFTTVEPVRVPVWIELGSSREDCIDDLYVMVHEDAELPEIPIARLPVDNPSELSTIVAKTLLYASGTTDGTWRNRALIVADDEWGEGASANETQHTINCDQIAEEVIPRWIEREKFYLIEYPWPGSPSPGGPHPDKPEAREDIIEGFTRGFGTMLYIGHGAQGQIAHEKLLLSEDISSLSNGPRLPVSFWATCDVGRFDSPGTDAISEALVLHPAGGCISSVAGTRGTMGYSNYLLMRGLMDSVYTDRDLTVGDALWMSKLQQSGSYQSNNKFYVMLGYPDLTLLAPDPSGIVSIQGDTLRGGELNPLSGISFGSSGLAFVQLLESSIEMVYDCLGGAEIEWLKYGGVAYRGTQSVAGGTFSLDCFVPLQSRVGGLARAGAVSLGGDGTTSGAFDPVVLVEGSPSGGDLEGPEVQMWISGYEGVTHPEVTGNVLLEVELTDPSGICILGGSSAKQLTLFLDGAGTDVGDYFSYRQGSTTSGSLQYEVGNPSTGEHLLILWSFDGLGNSSTDTLVFTSLEDVDLSLTELLVYPNPGDGPRCFSFRVTEDSRVTVSIFTVAGTLIEEFDTMCTQGYNQIAWDGLDSDGDPIATGSYIYRIEAVATGFSVFDRTAVETGILAVVREHGGGQ